MSFYFPLLERNNQNVLGQGTIFQFVDTVEPRYNDPRHNDIFDITMNIPCPGKSYCKMYGTVPLYNVLRYNDIPDLTMRN